MRALLVLNEKARRGARDGAAVCRMLEQCGIACSSPSEKAAVDIVLAAGGDGTLISCIPRAMQLDVPLGIIPLGTFNDLARTLGVPTDVEQACRAAASGNVRSIDVGRVNGRYFVNESSIGLSARIARRQTPEVKQRFGAFGVVSTALQSLFETTPFSAQIEYDGKVESFRTVQLTIANSGHFGGIIDRPDATIDDGFLDLYSVEISGWFSALSVVRKILAHDPSSGSGLRTRRAVRFVVRTNRPHHVSADGEPAGTTPATFEVLPHAVRILVP
jgi:diacylglycerol kinase (ATP)